MNPYICKKKRMDSEQAKEFYARLKVQLEESTVWPSDYLYKFIVPSEADRIHQIQKIFDNTGAVIESKKSKQGKYTSISVTVNCKDPDEVIHRYKEVGKVKGVISL
jgi:putative lipoic acid-binding regulatory protein